MSSRVGAFWAGAADSVATSNRRLPATRPILRKVLKPGSRVVSHFYKMGDWRPDASRTVPTADGDEYDIYLWRIPKKKGELPEWRLTAAVKPNEASGAFPRDEDPKYRDSAIYVRQKGVPNARATRIAIEGHATD